MSEASIYKIRASRVNSISAEQYDGYEGLIWYDTFTGELRIWDNNAPGGRLIYNNGPSTTNKLVNGAYELVLDASGNVTAPGAISAVGNISANYFVGNGSQLTGLPATYSNAQVSTYLASGTNSANIVTSANISGSYFIGNGSQLTGINVSTNKIFNGNSYANVAVANGNVEINANGRSWNFDTAGNLTLPTNTSSINYANGYPYGGGTSSLPPQTGNVGKILSTDGTNPLWETMPGVFGLVIDGGSAAYVSPDFIIDGGTAA